MTPKELIAIQFPGLVYIPMVDAGKAIGLAAGTCYNLYSKKRFPLRVRKIGTKSVVALTDLAVFMDDGVAPITLKEEITEKRRRGRPTKKEQRLSNLNR